MESLVSEVVEPNFGMTVSPRHATLEAPLTYSGIRETGHPNARGNMAEFFTHNAPDYGEEDTLLGPPGTSMADRFRRMALAMSLQAKTFSQDPLHTIFPWVGPTGATGGRTVGLAKNVGGDWSSMAGQYVGPNDMRAHK